MSALLAELRALEERLFAGSTRRNQALVESMLTADFREFGSSGRVFTKAEIVAALADEVAVELSGHDFEVQVLAADVALLTYISVKAGGEEALRSSLWVRSEGEWKMQFHQGTRVRPLVI